VRTHKKTAGVSTREKYSSSAGKKPTPIPRQSRDGACSAEGCEAPIHARRMCSKHYQWWWKREAGRLTPTPVKSCLECGEEFRGRGRFCSKRCSNRAYFEANRVRLLARKQERRVYKARV
jgi:hypothetical protein